MRWLALVLGLFARWLSSRRASRLAASARARRRPRTWNARRPAQPFDEWLEDLVDEARDARIPRRRWSRDALAGLEPLPRVIRATARRPSSIRGSTATSRTTRHDGSWSGAARSCRTSTARCWGAIEDEYDVQRRFVVAIWGMESRYGRHHRPDAGVPGARDAGVGAAAGGVLPRRAVRRAVDGVARHIDAPSMTGSWAGAMGQTQFMPSSYLKYAVDFDGDGRRDIWKHHRRRARLDRQLSQRLRLGRRRDVGPRSEGAGGGARRHRRDEFRGAPRAATPSAT